MFKKLDYLVLRTFIGPFIGSTFIISIILILQFFWKYLDDMAGKGLSIWVIFKLTMYLAATVIPLSLPIAVLFASLFTFGGMGERFELVAIKAAGISFLRFLRPVLILALLISGLAFWFSNNIMPYSMMRFQSILYEIVYQKPAFDLKAGVFYDKIEGFTIYINNKTDKGKTLNNIIIFETPKNAETPFRNVILAEKGNLKISEDATQQQVLIFSLTNGGFYQERGIFNNSKNDFTMTKFKNFRKILDMSSFKFMEKSGDSKSYQTMNIKELDSAITTNQKYGVFGFDYNKNLIDGHFPMIKAFGIIHAKTKIDSNYLKNIRGENEDTKSKEKINIKINNFLSGYANYQTEIENWNKHINKFKIEWHKKFTLSLSCFIFFLIGSALGAIIRKGGMGMPLIIAVGMFVFYFFLSSAFEKAAKVGDVNVFFGMWFSDFVLLPIGIFLSYKALNDSQLFNKDAYTNVYNKVLKLLKIQANPEDGF